MLTRSILFSVLLLSSLVASAEDFTEGEHYFDLSDSVPEIHHKAGIMEFFSFNCGACFAMRNFPNRFDESVSYNKYHVNFIGNKQVNERLTGAYASSTVLGLDEELRKGIFEEQFIYRKPVNSSEDLLRVLSRIDIDHELLTSSQHSFSTRSLINRMSQMAELYKVESTPVYIVNGVYKINNNSFRRSEDPVGDIEKLILYLLAK